MVDIANAEMHRNLKMNKSNDQKFMSIAIEQAKLGASTPGAAEVGCVIVRDGVVLVSGYNEAEMRFDPTAHAEIVTLRQLGLKERRIKFAGCTLYVTLQPCTMCTSACVWAGISRIVFGAARKDVHQMYFDARHIDPIDLIRDAYTNSISIVGGELESECVALYYRPQDHPPRELQTNIES
jgi:tRNA(adenine34) deaminase